MRKVILSVLTASLTLSTVPAQAAPQERVILATCPGYTEPLRVTLRGEGEAVHVDGFRQPVIGMSATGTITAPNGQVVAPVSEQVGQGNRTGQQGYFIVCQGTEDLGNGFTGNYTLTAFVPRPLR